MKAKELNDKYAQKVKELFVRMAADDKLPSDITQLDTTEIEKIFEPVFHVIQCVYKDAEMAMDGSWDCTTEEGIETGFGAQMDMIEEL